MHRKGTHRRGHTVGGCIGRGHIGGGHTVGGCIGREHIGVGTQ